MEELLDGKNVDEIQVVATVCNVRFSDGTWLSIFNKVAISGTAPFALNASKAAVRVDGPRVFIDVGEIRLAFDIEVPDCAGPETATLRLPDGTDIVYP